MTNIGSTNTNIVGTANTLAEARALARNNAGNEIIKEKKVGMFDKEYTVEKINPSDVNTSNLRLNGEFDPNIVEFSQDQNGKEIFIPNTSTNMSNVTTNIYNRARNDAENFKEKTIKVIDFVDTQTDKVVDFVEQKVDQAIDSGKKMIFGETTPRPTDGPVVKNNVGPEIIDQIKSGKVKMPIYVEIKNKESGKLSYFKLDQKVIDSLKEVEFPKDAQRRYGFTDVQDTKDGTITKGYGSTDTKLHKYLVAGKDAKAEKAAEAVLIYQAITHTDRFEEMPKAFLDHIDDNQKVGFLSAGFNMSKGLFVGGTARNPNADNPNGFEPIKMMKQYWQELTQNDGDLSLDDVKDAITKSLGSSISGGVSSKQSGLYTRRAFDFILSMGHEPNVTSPYGQHKVLSETLLNMLKVETNQVRKDSIQSVINDLKEIPKWKNYL